MPVTELLQTTREELTDAVLHASQAITDGIDPQQVRPYFIFDESRKNDPRYPGYDSVEVVAIDGNTLRRKSFTPAEANAALIEYREDMESTWDKIDEVEARTNVFSDYRIDSGYYLDTNPTGLVGHKLFAIYREIETTNDENGEATKMMQRFRRVLRWAKEALPTKYDPTISQDVLQRRISTFGFLLNSDKVSNFELFKGMRDLVLSRFSDEEFGELMTMVQQDALPQELLAVDGGGPQAREAFRLRYEFHNRVNPKTALSKALEASINPQIA